MTRPLRGPEGEPVSGSDPVGADPTRPADFGRRPQNWLEAALQPAAEGHPGGLAGVDHPLGFARV